MGFLAAVTAYAAPVFLIASPILTYTDQAMAMYRSKSSAGFSLDIPLIMLVSSICRYVGREQVLGATARKRRRRTKRQD